MQRQIIADDPYNNIFVSIGCTLSKPYNCNHAYNNSNNCHVAQIDRSSETRVNLILSIIVFVSAVDLNGFNVWH
jgi:hypothetical protein